MREVDVKPTIARTVIHSLVGHSVSNRQRNWPSVSRSPVEAKGKSPGLGGTTSQNFRYSSSSFNVATFPPQHSHCHQSGVHRVMMPSHSEGRSGDTRSPEFRMLTHSPMWGLPSFDPDCLAAMAYLKFLAHPFSVEDVNNADLSETGKLPVLVEGNTVVSGLSSVIEHLAAKGEGYSLDHWLTESQKAEAKAWRRVVDVDLTSYLLYNWWIEEQNYRDISQLPHWNTRVFPMNYVLPLWQYYSTMYAVGREFADLDEEKIYDELDVWYSALEHRLAQTDYKFFYSNFEGSSYPTSLDAVVFAHLAVHYFATLRAPKLAQKLFEHKRLIIWIQRILRDWFGIDLSDRSIRELDSGRTAEAKRKAAIFPKTGVVLLGVVGFGLAGYYLRKYFQPDPISHGPSTY